LIDQFLFEGLKVLLLRPKSNKNDQLSSQFQNSNFEIKRINCKPPRLKNINNSLKHKDYLEFGWFLLVESITVFRLILKYHVKKIYVRHSILTMQLPILFKLLRITTLADGEIVSDTLKELMPLFFFRILSSFEKRMLKFYTYFKVSSSSQVKNLVDYGYPRENILIVPVSINIDKIHRYSIEQIPEHTFGYFGSLEQWQSVDFLVKAFNQLVKRIPKALLYIIGEGSQLEDIKRIVNSENLSRNIVFVGRIKREELWKDYFAKFRIVIIPRQKLNNSIDTILPIKLVEALAAGKPVIAMEIPVMKEIHDNPLILVVSGSTELLANAMYSISNNLNEMKFRSELAVKSSVNYDIKINIQKLITILKN
jgi:glycosyltransferase involved in cell wall biosynthesis